MNAIIPVARAQAPAAASAQGDPVMGLLFPILVLFIAYFVYRKIKNKKEKNRNQRAYEELSEWRASLSGNSASPEKAANKIIQETEVGHNSNIFISYRRDDSADAAGRIYDRLINKFGKERVFKDVDSIPLGADFRDYIDRSISQSEVLLVVMGKAWLGQSKDTNSRRIDDPKDFSRLEVAAALKRNIPIIPLLVSGSKVPREQELPYEIRDLSYRNGVPVRPDPDFNHDIDRLITGIEKIANRVRAGD